jgi:hypothetical protein
VFIQLDHALMLHWMRSPTEDSHLSAVVLGMGRAAPLLRGAFAPTVRCAGYGQTVASTTRSISPPMRMMAFDYRVWLEQCGSSS